MALAINPQRFGSAFVRRKAARLLTEFLDGLNQDGKGAERVSRMIDTNRRVDSLLPPEKLQLYLDMAKQYAWAGRLISDEDLVNMLPAWVIAAVRSKGQPGMVWLREQITWLRGVFAE